MEIYKILFFLVTGALVVCLIFPRTKTNNVQGDLIEDQKIKDNSKTKAKKGILGFLKRDPEKKAKRKEARSLRKNK